MATTLNPLGLLECLTQSTCVLGPGGCPAKALDANDGCLLGCRALALMRNPEAIRDYRVSVGLSQRQLAHRVKVSYTLIQMIEDGKRKVTDAVLIPLWNEIFRAERERKQPPEVLIRLSNKFGAIAKISEVIGGNKITPEGDGNVR